MKRILLLFALCVCSVNLFADGKVYCEIVERDWSSKKTNVIVDFGQKREKSNMTSQVLVDENGEKIVFNSKIDALNYMGKLGWEFVQAYTVVSGTSSSTSSSIHWILSKEVADDEDPYNGLVTKESFDKR